MQDIVFLVADTDMQQALIGLLSQPKRLEIREVSYQIYKHDRRDPGCRTEAHSFLQAFAHQFQYAMVLFDYEGCGQESDDVEIIQHELEHHLTVNGWENRNRVVVIQPELEIWVWSDSPKVDECLGWSGKQPDLRTWLRQKNLLQANKIKPDVPKAAVIQALREARKPLSAALYRQLAESVSFKRCIDPGFTRLKTTLQTWFGINNA